MWLSLSCHVVVTELSCGCHYAIIWLSLYIANDEVCVMQFVTELSCGCH